MTHTCKRLPSEIEAEFDRREKALEEFVSKVHALQDEYSDSVTAFVLAIASITEGGAAKTYGGWSMPPDQENVAYRELADLLKEEQDDLLETVRHLSGPSHRDKMMLDA